jgi:hypothetical protein
MLKGTRVYIEFDDISADLHTPDQLDCVVAMVCGWVLSDTKRYVRIATCLYKDGCDYKDRMTIPKGCIVKMEKI